jgi:hypothetical protein
LRQPTIPIAEKALHAVAKRGQFGEPLIELLEALTDEGTVRPGTVPWSSSDRAATAVVVCCVSSG